MLRAETAVAAEIQELRDCVDELEMQGKSRAEVLAFLMTVFTEEPPAPIKAHDPVEHPAHYTSHPSGIECIDVVEHMAFNLGNAIKYVWRADLKANALEDLRKAAWYLQREIARRTPIADQLERVST